MVSMSQYNALMPQLSRKRKFFTHSRPPPAVFILLPPKGDVMASDLALKARQTSYQDTVINYISKDGGHVIALTDDQAFSTQLRLTLAKELGLSAPGLFTALTDPRSWRASCAGFCNSTLPRCFFSNALSVVGI